MSFRIVAPLTPRQNANQDPNANPNQVPRRPRSNSGVGARVRVSSSPSGPPTKG